VLAQMAGDGQAVGLGIMTSSTIAT
jgi:hypothetical protein